MPYICRILHASISQKQHSHYLVVFFSEKKGKEALTGKLNEPQPFDSSEIDEIANVNDVDDYLEMLYEDLPEKQRGTALLLQLARNPDNLEEIFQNGKTHWTTMFNL